MSKKVLDIIPPEEIESSETKRKSVSLLSKKKPLFVGGIILLIVVLVFSFFAFSNAEIKIWLPTEKVEIEKEITADKDLEQVNLSKNMVPLVEVGANVVKSEEFPATQKTGEKKAEGTIRVHNDAERSITLIEETRFTSASGKVFRAPEKMTIPGGGHVDTRVVAAAPGEEYNIGESKFSVPGLSGSWLYTKIHAESISPIKGGFVGKTYQVTEKDLEEAEKKILEKIKEEAESKILNKKEIIVFPKTIDYEVKETFSSAKEGMEAKNFNFRGEMKVIASGVRETHIDRISRYLLQNKSSKKGILESSFEMNIIKEREVNQKDGKVTFNLESSAKVHPEVDKEMLIGKLQNKSLSEASSLLNEMKAEGKIIKSKIEVWPIWLRSIPDEKEKIKVEFIID